VIGSGESAVRGRRYTDRGPAEDASIDLNALVEPYVGSIIVALVVVDLVLVLLVIVQSVRLGRVRRRVDGITRNENGRSLEAILDAHLDKVFAVSRELEGLTARATSVEEAARRSFQRVAIVRFNPFEDTGGNQSFALAMTDANGNGFVLSSLHARAGTRVYAKAVSAGRAEGQLSEEESEALQRALGAPADRTRPAA
jgi:hypothetical protein